MLVKCLGEAKWLKRGWVRGLDELWFAGPASTRRLEECNVSWAASVDARLSSRVPARAHQPKRALLRGGRRWARDDCATVIVARVHAANSSSSAFASLRSRVSKPSYTGASSSRACC